MLTFGYKIGVLFRYVRIINIMYKKCCMIYEQVLSKLGL